MARIELETEYVEKKSYHLVLDYGELESLRAILFFYRDFDPNASPARRALVENIFEHIREMDKLERAANAG